MEKFKFKTVGQFLVALEEGPLYCNKHKYELTENGVMVRITECGIDTCDSSLKSTLTAIKGLINHASFTRNPLLQDKCLIWCWDDGDNFTKTVRFYDGENNRTFSPSSGKRNFSWFENYEVIEPNEQGVYEEPFAWANEAVKNLED